MIFANDGYGFPTERVYFLASYIKAVRIARQKSNSCTPPGELAHRCPSDTGSCAGYDYHFWFSVHLASVSGWSNGGDSTVGPDLNLIHDYR